MASVGSLAEFETAFRAHIADMKAFGSDVPYSKSVDRFRDLLTKGPLKVTDVVENPERFIAGHRILSELATSLGPGFWIRFTVHFNLFSGTVCALGSPEQVAGLKELQKQGKVGCFGLTEVFAGVNSGLVVQTTADWDPERQMFLLHCPNEGAHKNWISQGLVADMCVAVADLRVGGKSYGAHAFLIPMRENGALVKGIEVSDMGMKTIGNDLDNARISFDKVWVPKAALLNRYGDVVSNEYVQKKKGTRNMDMIGQRLYSGRAVIARSTLVFTRSLYESTRRYTDNKKCWAPKQDISLSEVPQLMHLFKEADVELAKKEKFMGQIEGQLTTCLKEGRIPPQPLIDAIGAAKVCCVELAISLCWKLKQEVGSFALMSGSGFERLDYLQCCKFAEGDSRILMQKMSRDRVKAFQKGFKGPQAEVQCCEALLGKEMQQDPNKAHDQIYKLADLVMGRILDEYASPSARL